MIGRALRRADDLLFGAEAPARLLVVQTGFVAVMAVRIALSPFRDLTPQPVGLFRPVFFLEAFDRMPSVGVFLTLQIVGVCTALGWFAFGWSTRWRGTGRRVLFALTWMCLLVLVGFRASRGKILHNDLLLIWGALPLVFAPGDATFADRVPKARTGWSIRTAIVIISTAYFFTGVWKLRHTGITWVFSDNMRWIMYRGASGESPFPGVDLFIANRAWLSTLLAGCLLLFELTFPIVIVWKRIRPLYVVAALLIHLGTYVTLDLDYTMYASVVVLLLVDWPPLLDRLRRTAPSRKLFPNRRRALVR